MEDLKNIIKELNVKLHNARNTISKLEKQTRELSKKLDIANEGRDTLSRLLNDERSFSEKCTELLKDLTK